MSDDERAILAANAAFYAAVSAGDRESLAELCASEGVACIHPGWPPVDGREAVLESWAQIFDGGGPPAITCLGGRVYLHGDTAFVVCVERLQGGDLVATNYFVREGAAWRIAHHQAGPMPALQADDEPVH